MNLLKMCRGVVGSIVFARVCIPCGILIDQTIWSGSTRFACGLDLGKLSAGKDSAL